MSAPALSEQSYPRLEDSSDSANWQIDIGHLVRPTAIAVQQSLAKNTCPWMTLKAHAVRSSVSQSVRKWPGRLVASTVATESITSAFMFRPRFGRFEAVSVRDAPRRRSGHMTQNGIGRRRIVTWSCQSGQRIEGDDCMRHSSPHSSNSNGDSRVFLTFTENRSGRK